MLLLPLERESDQYRAPPTCRVGAATRYVQYFSFHPFSIAVGLFFPPALSSFKGGVRPPGPPPPPLPLSSGPWTLHSGSAGWDGCGDYWAVGFTSECPSPNLWLKNLLRRHGVSLSSVFTAVGKLRPHPPVLPLELGCRTLGRSPHAFHALKYTWEISDTSLAFLDIKISFEGNVLCTSVYYKLTDSYKRRSLKNCEKGMEFLPCDGCEDEYMNTVVFIFTSITRQELQTFFTVSQTSSFMYWRLWFFRKNRGNVPVFR